jgi:phosphate starvation-inducible protein PhoH and related proteins
MLKAPKLNGVLENEIILGTVPKYGNRRKQKKQNEKQLMNHWLEEDVSTNIQINNHQVTKPYESLRYLSFREKNDFEDKFHKPKNESQARYNQLLRNKNKKIVVANGPAGTGKTLFATEYGVKNFLTNTYDKLIFTRPSVSVDEDLGYLPGTLEEKMAPWVRPIYDILYRFMSAKEVSQLMEEKIIEVAPLGYMRGRTFENSWIVADEMQNSTVSQMKMLLTRLGKNSRLVITGDLEQHDKAFEINGLEDFLGRMKGKRSSSISSFEFDREDIQREEVVKEVLDIYGGETLPDYSSESNESEETTNDCSLDDERPEVNSLPS